MAPAGSEAYLPVPEKYEDFPLILRVYDAIEAFLDERADLVDLSAHPYEIYPGTEARFDVAYPVTSAEREAIPCGIFPTLATAPTATRTPSRWCSATVPPSTAVIEVATGGPFGMQLIGGTLVFFDAYGWNPELGFDQALTAHRLDVDE